MSDLDEYVARAAADGMTIEALRAKAEAHEKAIRIGEVQLKSLEEKVETLEKPVALLLSCPICHVRHVDAGEFAIKPHHTHACQACGFVWRPAIVPTVGVQFLPGFKDPAP